MSANQLLSKALSTDSEDEAITCLRNAGILYDRKTREFVDDGFRSHSRYRSNSIADLPAADRIEGLVKEIEVADDAINHWMAAYNNMEAKLDKALAALDEAIYMLNPDEEDMAKEAGVYRIVTTYKELKGET